MLDYIVRDIIAISRYLPTGLFLGIPLGLVFLSFGGQKKHHGRTGRFLFGLCLGFILTVTYFSREIGSAGEIIDLKLFSTWEINVRNRAYLVENLLLFMPFGACFGIAYGKKPILWHVFLVGFVTSLGIETMQLITKRGIFQLDDILTNVLGAVAGGLIYLILRSGERGRQS